MQGDPGSERREQLVRDHLRLAYDHARRMYGARPRGGLDVEDLEQEAVLGLMAAAERYDEAAHPGVPFAAFSRRYVIQRIAESIAVWKRYRADPLSVDLPAPSPDAGADRLALEVWDMLDQVPARPRALLVRRYGLDGEPALGLIQLSEEFGLPARTVGRLLAIGRAIVRRECSARGFSFDRWAEAAAAVAIA